MVWIWHGYPKKMPSCLNFIGTWAKQKDAPGELVMKWWLLKLGGFFTFPISINQWNGIVINMACQMGHTITMGYYIFVVLNDC